MNVIFSGTEIVNELIQLGITHVVWVPDSDLGRWETDLESSSIKLVRVCREGEAWPLAAGLLVGGMSPLVMIQATGLFESGDALRNIAHDLGLPVFSIIGIRNWLNESSEDSAKRFAEPIVRAWGIDYLIVESRADRYKLQQHYTNCRSARRPGAILLAE
jgi:sulfopyruvate decarboxylase TPP-binding subunit